MRFLIFAIILGLMNTMPVSASSIKSDEEIIFFPTAARMVKDEWIVPVHAWVFEPEKDSYVRQSLIVMLAKNFELEETAAQSEVFRERAKWFLVDNERGKNIRTSLSPKTLVPTGANGHAEGEFRVRIPRSASSLIFMADLPDEDKRIFKGEVLLVTPKGVSVISDIDDTIKISEVTAKRKLLENTFLKPFEVVPGMVDAYKRLAAGGAVFHYVSSSPWQLYPALIDFMKRKQYPFGSFHLRKFRLKDKNVFNVLKSSETTKPPIINRLLMEYPKRDFILVGDSGEKDPEIYGKIARKNPGRISHIYIRCVTAETPGNERYQKAFRSLSPLQWTVFDDASVIALE